MENLLHQVELIRDQGMFVLAAEPDAPLAAVATADIARTAAELLTDPTWTRPGGRPCPRARRPHPARDGADHVRERSGSLSPTTRPRSPITAPSTHLSGRARRSSTPWSRWRRRRRPASTRPRSAAPGRRSATGASLSLRRHSPCRIADRHLGGPVSRPRGRSAPFVSCGGRPCTARTTSAASASLRCADAPDRRRSRGCAVCRLRLPAGCPAGARPRGPERGRGTSACQWPDDGGGAPVGQRVIQQPVR